MHRAARVAGRAAPAVVVVGALAAIPQVRGLISGPSAAPVATGHHTATDPIAGDQVVNVPADNPASFKNSRYRPRQTEVISPSRPARRRVHSSAGPSARATRSARPATSHPAASPSVAASAGGHGSPTCSGTEGMLPANYAAIVGFLTAHGYTGLAAAGIAGNIYQESRGNPESVGSGGGGLIGWTPLPAGFVTGSPSADLQTQLNALLTFNQQWAQYIPALNAATSAAGAADIYMTDFERPGIPAAGNREAAATAVATACGL